MANIITRIPLPYNSARSATTASPDIYTSIFWVFQVDQETYVDLVLDFPPI